MTTPAENMPENWTMSGPNIFHEAMSDEAFVRVPRELLELLVEAEDCWFDHHGGCQGHGYLALEPGEKCPQFELKELLADDHILGTNP